MKKYSEEFINSSNILKNAIVGVELEFYTNKLSFYKMLEYLNNYLKINLYVYRSFDNFKVNRN